MNRGGAPSVPVMRHFLPNLSLEPTKRRLRCHPTSLCARQCTDRWANFLRQHFFLHFSGDARDMLNSPSIKLHRKLNVPFISGTEAFIAGTFCVEIWRPVEEIQCVSWRKADVWGPFSRQTTATAATSSSTLHVFYVMFVWKYKYKTQPTFQALYILQI